MQDLARLLIILGIVILLAGIVLLISSKLGLGRLPGDIVIEKGNFKIFIPLMTSLLLSIILSLVLWLWRR